MSKPTIIDKALNRTILPVIPQAVTPNAITVVRLILTPCVIYLLIKEVYNWGFFLFLITALTDAIDGALARTRNMITDWGKTYDPFADKLLVLGVSFIVLPRFFNPYLLGSMCVIEICLLANKLYLEKFKKSKIIEANRYGKIKMVMYCVGLGALIIHLLSRNVFFLSLSESMLYASLVPAIISLVVYRSI